MTDQPRCSPGDLATSELSPARRSGWGLRSSRDRARGNAHSAKSRPLLCRSPHLRDDIASAVMFAGKRSTTMGDKSPKNTAKTKKQKGAKAAAAKGSKK